jgi:hypothetical protein
MTEGKSTQGSGGGWGEIPCSFLEKARLQTRRMGATHAKSRISSGRFGDGCGASEAMLLQIAFSALHLDILIGRKLGADAAVGGIARPEVVAIATLKCAFQVPTD